MKPSTSLPSNEIESLFAEWHAGMVTVLIIAFTVVIYSLCKRWLPTLNEKVRQRRVKKLSEEYETFNTEELK